MAATVDRKKQIIAILIYTGYAGLQMRKLPSNLCQEEPLSLNMSSER